MSGCVMVDRPAEGNLALEKGYHAAAASQHVAKAHHRESPAGAPGGVQNDHISAMRLVVPITLAGRYGLSVETITRALDVGRHTNVDHIAGAHNVVGDRLGHVVTCRINGTCL